MNYLNRLIAAILGGGIVLIQIQNSHALTKVEVSKIAQSFTLMIQSPQDSGSGIIIKHQGDIYTILTAHHVVQQSATYKVMTPDQKLYSIVQGSIQELPKVDLALLQFKSTDAYGVAKLGDSSQSPSGSTCFVAGFPGTTEVRSQPEYYFTSGDIAANGTRPNKDGYALAYTNPTLPGMSGGPVLNEKGELIGVHGRAERAEQLENAQFRKDIAILKTEFNYAIPINTFLSLIPKDSETLAFKPPKPIVDTAPKADDFFLLADDNYRAGNMRGAIQNYTQALRLNPSYAEAYAGRGNARDNLGDKQGALSDYNEAVRLNSNEADNFYNRGLVRDELGDKQGALSDYNRAISLNPNDADTYGERGTVRDELGDKQGALSDYNQAIILNPNDVETYYNRGILRDNLGDKQGAFWDLKRSAAMYKAKGDEKSYKDAVDYLQQMNRR